MGLTTKAASSAAALSAAMLIAMSLAVPSGTASAMALARAASPVPGVVPVASSDAHKGIGGRYGGLKELKGPGTPSSRGFDKGPSFNSVVPKGDARKQPYPSRYYDDTSRGNYGCHRYGKRAIDTDNANWWARYRACAEVGSD